MSSPLAPVVTTPLFTMSSKDSCSTSDEKGIGEHEGSGGEYTSSIWPFGVALSRVVWCHILSMLKERNGLTKFQQMMPM